MLPTLLRLIILAHATMNGVQQQVHSSPLVFPNLAHAKKIIPRVFKSRLFGGYFKHSVYCEKRKKKMNNSKIRPFLVCHFKIVIHTLPSLLQTGTSISKFLYASICFLVMVSSCKHNTLIGTAILFQAIHLHNYGLHYHMYKPVANNCFCDTLAIYA